MRRHSATPQCIALEERRGSSTSIVLTNSNSRPQPIQEAENNAQEFSLPPTDGGKDAWLCLAGAFVVEAMTWGFPFTFGIFQEHYSSLPQFRDQKSQVALIGTIALGILYLGSPVSLMYLRQQPQNRRRSMVAGLIICTISHVAASFANRVWQLILTQGVLYAIGGSLMYYPILLFLDEWFVRRKGLAYGIAWAGTGCSGLVIPFLVSWCLDTYSFRTTLRMWAIVGVVLVVPLLPFVKPRLPVTSISHPRGIPSLRFSISRPFLPLFIGSCLESLGYFLPGLYLPTYVSTELGYPSTISTISVVLLNTGAFFGSLMVGTLVDRWHVTSVVLLCTTGATLSVFFLWGFSGSAVALCIFAFIYGFFAGSFSSIWPGIVLETMKSHNTIESGFVYSFLVSGRGLGSVISGPLSNSLLRSGGLTRKFGYGYVASMVP